MGTSLHDLRQITVTRSDEEIGRTRRFSSAKSVEAVIEDDTEWLNVPSVVRDVLRGVIERSGGAEEMAEGQRATQALVQELRCAHTTQQARIAELERQVLASTIAHSETQAQITALLKKFEGGIHSLNTQIRTLHNNADAQLQESQKDILNSCETLIQKKTVQKGAFRSQVLEVLRDSGGPAISTHLEVLADTSAPLHEAIVKVSRSAMRPSRKEGGSVFEAYLDEVMTGQRGKAVDYLAHAILQIHTGGEDVGQDVVSFVQDEVVALLAGACTEKEGKVVPKHRAAQCSLEYIAKRVHTELAVSSEEIEANTVRTIRETEAHLRAKGWGSLSEDTAGLMGVIEQRSETRFGQFLEQNGYIPAEKLLESKDTTDRIARICDTRVEEIITVDGVPSQRFTSLATQVFRPLIFETLQQFGTDLLSGGTEGTPASAVRKLISEVDPTEKVLALFAQLGEAVEGRLGSLEGSTDTIHKVAASLAQCVNTQLSGLFTAYLSEATSPSSEVLQSFQAVIASTISTAQQTTLAALEEAIQAPSYPIAATMRGLAVDTHEALFPQLLDTYLRKQGYLTAFLEEWVVQAGSSGEESALLQLCEAKANEGAVHVVADVLSEVATLTQSINEMKQANETHDAALHKMADEGNEERIESIVLRTLEAAPKVLTETIQNVAQNTVSQTAESFDEKLATLKSSFTTEPSQHATHLTPTILGVLKEAMEEGIEEGFSLSRCVAEISRNSAQSEIHRWESMTEGGLPEAMQRFHENSSYLSDLVSSHQAASVNAASLTPIICDVLKTESDGVLSSLFTEIINKGQDMPNLTPKLEVIQSQMERLEERVGSMGTKEGNKTPLCAEEVQKVVEESLHAWGEVYALKVSEEVTEAVSKGNITAAVLSIVADSLGVNDNTPFSLGQHLTTLLEDRNVETTFQTQISLWEQQNLPSAVQRCIETDQSTLSKTKPEGDNLEELRGSFQRIFVETVEEMGKGVMPGEETTEMFCEEEKVRLVEASRQCVDRVLAAKRSEIVSGAKEMFDEKVAGLLAENITVEDVATQQERYITELVSSVVSEERQTEAVTTHLTTLLDTTDFTEKVKLMITDLIEQRLTDFDLDTLFAEQITLKSDAIYEEALPSFEQISQNVQQKVLDRFEVPSLSTEETENIVAILEERQRGEMERQVEEVCAGFVTEDAVQKVMAERLGEGVEEVIIKGASDVIREAIEGELKEIPDIEEKLSKILQNELERHPRVHEAASDAATTFLQDTITVERTVTSVLSEKIVSVDLLSLPWKDSSLQDFFQEELHHMAKEVLHSENKAYLKKEAQRLEGVMAKKIDEVVVTVVASEAQAMKEDAERLVLEVRKTMQRGVSSAVQTQLDAKKGGVSNATIEQDVLHHAKDSVRRHRSGTPPDGPNLLTRASLSEALVVGIIEEVLPVHISKWVTNNTAFMAGAVLPPVMSSVEAWVRSLSLCKENGVMSSPSTTTLSPPREPSRRSEATDHYRFSEERTVEVRRERERESRERGGLLPAEMKDYLEEHRRSVEGMVISMVSSKADLSWVRELLDAKIDAAAVLQELIRLENSKANRDEVCFFSFK